MNQKQMETPLFLDTTSKLVTSGPYKHVRNPMVIAGLGHGLCVAAFFESTAIFFYIFSGYALWTFFIRPLEKLDMLKFLGMSFENTNLKYDARSLAFRNNRYYSSFNSSIDE